MNISISGVDQAVKQLENYNKTLSFKIKDLISRLADIGISYAQRAFSVAKYSGINDVYVSPAPEWISDRQLRIVASGDTVLFIEFGTGVFTPDDHPQAHNLGMIRGGYGLGRGNNPNGWVFLNLDGGNNAKLVRPMLGMGLYWTKGDPANKCMWYASEVMKQQITQIAKEVFSQ